MNKIRLPARYLAEGDSFEGGQATIYVCRDTYLDRRVAIKIMKGVPDDLYNEISAIQGIRSRHVAQIYDVIRPEESGFLGLVQEYVPGPTVNQFSKSSNLAQDYLRVLYQIACGLAEIHECGKIHRDIKPGNIKFDDENVVKILDFGFSTNSASDVQTVDARGTHCYIAPELFGSPPVRYTNAVDTFAFGVMARTIAEGGAVLPAFRQTPPYTSAFPSFTTCPVGLTQEIATILNRTLEIDPRNRPKIAEVRDRLGGRLLYGQHRAIITNGAQLYELSSVGQSVRLNRGLDTITIGYDGLQFMIQVVSGDVYINNTLSAAGEVLPDACVITLGHDRLASQRSFIPFSVSHPGVVL